METPAARHAVVLVAAAAIDVLVAVLVAAPLAAQIPETFTNLQILPRDTSRDELVAVMRGFSFATGARCEHCHVAENAADFATFDFASDDREPKRVARAMMRMTREINERLLPTIGRESVREVTCRTCHHGLPRPSSLEVELREAHAEGGAAAAVARYRDLRAKLYGRGKFDFGEWSLLEAARPLAATDPAAALALADLQLEHFPESSSSHFFRAELLQAAGDLPGAIAAYERALAIEPNPRLAERIATLRAELAAGEE